MHKPLSDDLPCRISQAYLRREGSQAKLARRFGVSFEYVRRIRRQRRLSGRMGRQPQSRHDRLSRIAAAVKEQLRARARKQPGRMLAELGEQIQAQGTGEPEPLQSDPSSDGSATEKKSLHALERNTEVNRKRSEEFLAAVATIPPEKLKSLDERGVTTKMTRLWGRAPRGERVTEAMPDGRRQVLTTLGP